MKTTALIVGFVLSFAAVGFGQTRTVTNTTLEKYQQRRIAAERELRENYARLGFPSPEELEKQREADMDARLKLAEQLRQARLDKERLELERRGLDLEAARLVEVEQGDGFNGGYIGGFGTGGFGFDGRHRFRRFSPLGGFNQRGGYRVNPFGLIPVPAQPRPQTIIRTRPSFLGRRR